MNRTPARSAADTHESETRSILDGIRHLVRALRLSARDAEDRVGLSAAQLFVLHKLADGAALSLGELAARTLTHQSSVSVVVTRLVEKGFVARVRSASDGRRVEIAITAAGRRLLSKAPDAAQEGLIAAIGRLQGTTRKGLARGLAQLVNEMGITEDAPLFFEEEPGGARTQGSRGRNNGRS